MRVPAMIRVACLLLFCVAGSSACQRRHARQPHQIDLQEGRPIRIVSNASGTAVALLVPDFMHQRSRTIIVSIRGRQSFDGACAAISDSGTLGIFFGSDGVRLVELASNRVVRSVRLDGQAAIALANDEFLILGGSNVSEPSLSGLYRMTSAGLSKPITSANRTAGSVAVSPNRKYVSVQVWNNVRVYDLGSGELLRVVEDKELRTVNAVDNTGQTAMEFIRNRKLPLVARWEIGSEAAFTSSGTLVILRDSGRVDLITENGQLTHHLPLASPDYLYTRSAFLTQDGRFIHYVHESLSHADRVDLAELEKPLR
jgi:hypothetical protein